LFVIQNFFSKSSTCSDFVETGRAHDLPMADFLVVVGIVGFALLMLGLIWALDRV
jgi:hypothetical protein